MHGTNLARSERLNMRIRDHPIGELEYFFIFLIDVAIPRSEERRVGKECLE